MPPALGYIRGQLSIPQTAQVRMLWRYAESVGSNVLHAIVPDGYHWTQADVDDVMNGIVASAGWASLNALLTPSAALLGLEIKDLRAVFPTPPFAGIPSSVPEAVGVNVGDNLPDQLAITVSLKTAQSGRSFRGRVYLSGWAKDACDAVGLPTTAAKDAALTFVQDVSGALLAKNFELAIGHRGHALYLSPATGLEVPAEAAGSVPVTSITCKPHKFDTQRRRV
jgi:hypothetical protein